MAFDRNGYGQVEPNQLSAQKTGQIFASLPLDANVSILQNGEFMFYDIAAGKVSATDSVGGAEPMLVFNEIKLYEPFWRTSYKDFAMIRVGDNYVTSKLATAGYGDGSTTEGAEIDPAHTEYGYRMDGIAPRLFKTNIGDIYTTNMVDEKAAADYTVGKILTLKKSDRNTLVLTSDEGTITILKFAVVKDYTMPDGQRGLKLQRIA